MKVFNHILELCIRPGMVDGRIQAVDSALRKANASMSSLRMNLKIADQKYYNKLNNSSEEDNTKYPILLNQKIPIAKKMRKGSAVPIRARRWPLNPDVR